MKTPPINLAAPRLVNRFKLGCDPEFALEGPFGTILNANSISLEVDAAFGCDGSGRPVELRAYPSKFAVEVVASLLNTMRFLAMFNREARGCQRWLTGGYALKQPLGGHIHFGRKIRLKSRKYREWAALDDLSCALYQIGYLPGQANRISVGRYGTLGDIRSQSHGFEYRVFPSWLHTPWFAHLMLTLGKLTIREPGAWKDCLGGRACTLKQIEKLLKAYCYLDDDAALALYSLRWLKDGFLTPFNLKPEWGLDEAKASRQTLSQVPPVIKPDKQAILEIIEAIRTGKPPAWREPLVESEGSKPKVDSKPPLEMVNLVSPLQFWDFAVHYRPRAVQGLYSPKGIEMVSWQDYNEEGLSLCPQVASILEPNEIKALQSVAGLAITSHSGLDDHFGIGINPEFKLDRQIQVFTENLPIAFGNQINKAWVSKWQERFARVGLLRVRKSKQLQLPYEGGSECAESVV